MLYDIGTGRKAQRKNDGRWIAEVPELAGVLAYGATKEEAAAKAEALALQVLVASSAAQG
jgi:predicted RNase H-like HicB family nuclease